MVFTKDEYVLNGKHYNFEINKYCIIHPVEAIAAAKHATIGSTPNHSKTGTRGTARNPSHRISL